MGVPNTFRLGIFVPSHLTDMTIIHERLFPKLHKIVHVSTNDVGDMLVARFCEENKLPHTVYPIPPCDGGVFISNEKIIANSGLIIIFDDGTSKNAAHIKELCEKCEKQFLVYDFKQDTAEVRCRKVLEKLNTEVSKDEPNLDKIRKMIRKELYGETQ